MNSLASAYINTVSLGRSQIVKVQTVSRLNQLGLRLHFPHIPTGWVAAVQPTDLTVTWQQAGLPLSGVGFSTIGGLVPGTKTCARFWPTSPFYQAKLGGYLIQAPAGWGSLENGSPDPDMLLRILLSDLCSWLKTYGCSQPQAVLQSENCKVENSAAHQDYPTWLIHCSIRTKSDVGSCNRSANNLINYRVYELMFAYFGGARLPALCTLPPTWPLASYHSLDLDCASLAIQLARRNQWALLYCCAARWGGRDYFPAIYDEAFIALEQARIISG